MGNTVTKSTVVHSITAIVKYLTDKRRLESGWFLGSFVIVWVYITKRVTLIAAIDLKLRVVVVAKVIIYVTIIVDGLVISYWNSKTVI